MFSTKGRRPFLKSAKAREELHRYLGGTCNQVDCPVIRVGGVEDHVHILCRFGRSLSVADLIQALKCESSQWVKEQDANLGEFHWQNGYGAFSVSPSHVEGLIKYIENQAEHHRRVSFQDEFRRLLTLYEIEWDERYVWD